MKNDDDDDEDRRAIADRTLLFDNSSMIDMGILNDLVGGGDCNALYLLLLYFRDNDCSIEFSKVCRQGARLLDSRRLVVCWHGQQPRHGSSLVGVLLLFR